MIRHDYPLLSKWLRNLYWDESVHKNHGAFKNTTFFDAAKYGYLQAKSFLFQNNGSQNGKPRVPLIIRFGPEPLNGNLTTEEVKDIADSLKL